MILSTCNLCIILCKRTKTFILILHRYQLLPVRGVTDGISWKQSFIRIVRETMYLIVGISTSRFGGRIVCRWCHHCYNVVWNNNKQMLKRIKYIYLPSCQTIHKWFTATLLMVAKPNKIYLYQAEQLYLNSPKM